MCGRYYIMKQIYQVLKDMGVDVQWNQILLGDCFPKQKIPVIIENHGKVVSLQVARYTRANNQNGTDRHYHTNHSSRRACAWLHQGIHRAAVNHLRHSAGDYILPPVGRLGHTCAGGDSARGRRMAVARIHHGHSGQYSIVPNRVLRDKSGGRNVQVGIVETAPWRSR